MRKATDVNCHINELSSDIRILKLQVDDVTEEVFKTVRTQGTSPLLKMLEGF